MRDEVLIATPSDLFIDEIHNIIGAGDQRRHDGRRKHPQARCPTASCAASARPLQDYRQAFERDPRCRPVQRIDIRQPTVPRRSRS